MKNSTIEKDDDLYGFYNDLVETLKSELLGLLEDKGAKRTPPGSPGGAFL